MRNLFFVIILALIFLPLTADAQRRNKPLPPSTQPNTDASVGTNQGLLGNIEDEMLARNEIKTAEKDRLENLERAREAAQLGIELRDSFRHSKSLSRDDVKKLERLEKLTRRIRNQAGGSDGDVTIENYPTQVEAALDRLAEFTESLNKDVEKTSRHVVSAGVIIRANEILEIVRYIKANLP